MSNEVTEDREVRSQRSENKKIFTRRPVIWSQYGAAVRSRSAGDGGRSRKLGKSRYESILSMEGQNLSRVSDFAWSSSECHLLILETDL